jgi:hypothetical protein
MMAALRRLIGTHLSDPDEGAERAESTLAQVAELLADISAQTQRLERKGWRHGGRPEPGRG